MAINPAHTDDSNEASLTNFAFANYIGTGLYRAADQEVSVLNLPFSYTPEQQSGYQMTWRLPIALGYYNFDFDEIDEDILPHNADTVTFAPGVEWDIPITSDLLFRPYIDLGWGKNFTSDESVFIYSTGISSHYQFGDKNKEHLWVNRLLVAGYRGLSDHDTRDGYASLQSGVDWQLIRGFTIADRGSFISIYGLAQWHFNQVEFARPERQTVTLNNNIEVGLTLGVVKPLDFELFDLDKIGIGYRFGDGLNLWRLTFNSPL
jgi:hypothetical protein